MVNKLSKLEDGEGIRSLSLFTMTQMETIEFLSIGNNPISSIPRLFIFLYPGELFFSHITIKAPLIHFVINLHQGVILVAY